MYLIYVMLAIFSAEYYFAWYALQVCANTMADSALPYLVSGEVVTSEMVFTAIVKATLIPVEDTVSCVLSLISSQLIACS